MKWIFLKCAKRSSKNKHMSNDINLLITLSNGVYLIKFAIKLKIGMLSEDVIKYYQEPENKEKFINILPMHVRSFGNIVEVEEIFEVKDLTK